MKNIFSELVPYYFEQLSRFYRPVYDGMAPDTETGSYILIGDRGSNQLQDKSGYTFTADILVDIVEKNGNFGYQSGDELAGQIVEIINSDSTIDLDSFQVITTRLSSQNYLPGLNPTVPSFRTLLRFQHFISQL